MPYNPIWTESIEPLLTLKAARFRIDLKATERWRIWGSEISLRGRLGFNLKRMCCPYLNFRRRDCDDCELTASCLYLKLFAPTAETPKISADSQLKTRPTSVRPYVIALEGADGRYELEPDQTGCVDITLFGPGIRYASLFLEAAVSALSFFPVTVVGIACMRPPGAEMRMAENQIAWPLHAWVGADDVYADQKIKATVTSDEDILLVDFITPVRLFSRSRQAREKVSLSLMLKVLVRRLRDLKRRYDNDSRMGRTGENFFQTAQAVRVADDRLWYGRRKRFSYRQRQEIFLNGLRGNIYFQGPFHPFLPLLCVGEIIGVGKGISCGNGKIRVRVVDKGGLPPSGTDFRSTCSRFSYRL